MKKYQIKTVEDMINCTNESNLENFIADLTSVIKVAHSLQGVFNAIAETENIPKELVELKSNGYTWIDDGEHKITVQLKKIKNESNIRI